MESLTPLAQVCVILIQKGHLSIDEAPPIVKEEVENYYNEHKEGEDV